MKSALFGCALLVLLVAQATAGDRQDLLRLAEQRDPELASIRAQIKGGAVQRQLTQQRYGLQVDSSVGVYRDPAHMADALVDDLNGATFIDYQGNRSILDLQSLYRGLGARSTMEERLVDLENARLEAQLAAKARCVRRRANQCIAAMWALKDSKASLEDQVFLVNLMARNVREQRRLGLGRPGDGERVQLLQNWVENEAAGLEVLQSAKRAQLRAYLGDDFDVEGLEKGVAQDDFVEALRVPEGQQSYGELEQRAKLDKGLSRLKGFDALNRSWKVSLGARYYEDSKVYSVETNSDLDLKAGAKLQDHYGSGGKLFGFFGDYQQGTLSYMKVDLNILGQSPATGRKGLEAEVEGLRADMARAERDRRSSRQGAQAALQIALQQLQVREKNLAILGGLEKIQFQDFRAGELALNDLIRFEVDAAKDRAEICRARLEALDKVAALAEGDEL